MKLPQNPWPWAILLTFVVFISGTVSLIVMASSQREDLVSNTYYEQELKFQGHLDELERTSRLGAAATVAYDPVRRGIAIQLPPEHARKHPRGTIQLYRPSAANLDQQRVFQPDAAGAQLLDATRLAPGLWKIRVYWTVDKQDFFLDQKLIIPHQEGADAVPGTPAPSKDAALAAPRAGQHRTPAAPPGV